MDLTVKLLISDLVHKEYMEKNSRKSNSSYAFNERRSTMTVIKSGFKPCLKLQYDFTISNAQIKPLMLKTLLKINLDVLATLEFVNLV
jgi:hypothetical protein